MIVIKSKSDSIRKLHKSHYSLLKLSEYGFFSLNLQVDNNSTSAS